MHSFHFARHRDALSKLSPPDSATGSVSARFFISLPMLGTLRLFFAGPIRKRRGVP